MEARNEMLRSHLEEYLEANRKKKGDIGPSHGDAPSEMESSDTGATGINV